MRKTTLIIVSIILVILFVTINSIWNKQAEIRSIQQKNKIYEYYLDKEIYGTEVVSLINKVINENEKNNVPKDAKGYYIDDEKTSIEIELNMITIEKTYPMEVIYNNDITKFVENFNLILFKCSNIEYHEKTGSVKKIIFEQLQK